jgi:hypothetical protein
MQGGNRINPPRHPVVFGLGFAVKNALDILPGVVDWHGYMAAHPSRSLRHQFHETSMHLPFRVMVAILIALFRSQAAHSKHS